MKPALTIRVTRRAALQIDEANAWWQRNRLAAPHAMLDELDRAFSLLASQPDVGGKSAKHAIARGTAHSFKSYPLPSLLSSLF